MAPKTAEPSGWEARAPTRIDLAGGTLDIWPLSVLVEDAVTVNVALDLPARARVSRREDGCLSLASEDLGRRRTLRRSDAPARAGALELVARLARAMGPETGVDVVTRASVPAGSGLGGSSALAVAVAAALDRLAGRRRDRRALLRLVRDHETRVLGSPAGIQDHVAALHGGVSALRLGPGGWSREALAVSPSALEERLVLVYSGRSRFSGAGNWAVVRAVVEGRKRVRGALEAVAGAARALRGALAAGDWDEAARSVREEWAARRRLAPEVTAGGMADLVARGRRAGALAGKVCGAGGGGCLVFLCEPDRREEVAAALAAAGAGRLAFRVARRGVRISAWPPGR